MACVSTNQPSPVITEYSQNFAAGAETTSGERLPASAVFVSFREAAQRVLHNVLQALSNKKSMGNHGYQGV